MTPTITRRRLIGLATSIAATGLIAACGGGAAPAQKAPATPAAPPPTPKPISPQAPVASPAASPAPGASPSPVAKPAASAPAPASAAKRGGTLTFIRTAEHRGFNPAHMDAGGTPMIRALYNTLLRYDNQLNIVPELAEKYEVPPDGQSIKLELRKGVKFHSGREVTADDVEFSVKWFQDEKNGAPIRGQANLVKQVEKSGTHTVTLRFDKPNVSVYDLLDAMSIVDQSVADKIPTMDAGSGPFKVGDFRPGESTKLVPFTDYWERGKPYLNEYIVKPVPDAQQMVVQIETGVADVLWIPTYGDLQRFSQNPKYQTANGAPGAIFWDIAVNVKAEHTTDKRVRQAISYALDRERFAATAMRGFVKPTSLPYPPTSWAYFPDLEGKHNRDVAKAKQLVEAAGKVGAELRILTSSKRTAGQSELTQILQANLEEIGLKSKIEDVEFAVYESRSRISDWDLMVHSYGRANKDPQTLFTGAIAWYARGQSWTKYDGEEYAKLIDQAGSIVDREQRKPIYRRLTEIILEDCFTIPVCEAPRAFIYQSFVKDLRVTLDNMPFAGDVWLDK